MRLRSFTAPTIADAMQLVRNELGADAVILSTQRLDKGEGVQVTAGLEAPERMGDSLVPGAAGTIEAVDAVGAALEFHGLPPVIADRLLTAAADLLVEDPVMALAGALDAQFGFARLDALIGREPIMLVGTPGAGKTATIAKLAARARLENRRVVAVTCDVFRAGAVEQLATYAKMLEIQAYRAKDAAALAAALAAAPQDALVLIDTVGSNPLDGDEMGRLAEYIAAAEAQPILVLAAGGDVVESADCAAAFSELGARRLIATRIDAARRLGGVLSAAQIGKLTLAALGTSPQIASGLGPVNPVSLARLMMAPAGHGSEAALRNPDFRNDGPSVRFPATGTHA
jgi:flagellar biosynthesis protein FlhF